MRRQRLQLVARLRREHQQRAVGRPLRQPVEERHLAFVLVEGRREDDGHVLLVSASAAPERIGEKYAAWTIGMATPTRPVRPPERARAFRFIAKPWSRTTRRTVSRVSGATSGRSLRTRETVAIETPAALATSRIVARPACSSACAQPSHRHLSLPLPPGTLPVGTSVGSRVG